MLLTYRTRVRVVRKSGDKMAGASRWRSGLWKAFACHCWGTEPTVPWHRAHVVNRLAAIRQVMTPSRGQFASPSLASRADVTCRGGDQQ